MTLMRDTCVKWYPIREKTKYQTYPSFKKAIVLPTFLRNFSAEELPSRWQIRGKSFGKPMTLLPVTPSTHRCFLEEDFYQNHRPPSIAPSFQIQGDDPPNTGRHHNQSGYLPPLTAQPPSSRRLRSAYYSFEGESTLTNETWYDPSNYSASISYRTPRGVRSQPIDCKKRPSIPKLRLNWDKLSNGETDDMIQVLNVYSRTGNETKQDLLHQTSITLQWLRNNQLERLGPVFSKKQIFLCDLLTRDVKEWCYELRHEGVGREDMIRLRTLVLDTKQKLIAAQRSVHNKSNNVSGSSKYSKCSKCTSRSCPPQMQIRMNRPMARKGTRSKRKVMNKKSPKRTTRPSMTEAMFGDKLGALFRTSMARKKHLEVMWAQSVLGKKMVKELMSMYHAIDIDRSGSIDQKEVLKFNVFLNPFAEIKTVKRDTDLLFKLADGDRNGVITEMEWLKGWTVSASRSGGNTTAIAKFIEQFRKRQTAHTQIVTAFQFNLNVLVRILRWVRKKRKKILPNDQMENRYSAIYG